MGLVQPLFLVFPLVLTVFGENVIGTPDGKLGDNGPEFLDLLIAEFSCCIRSIGVSATLDRVFIVASEFIGGA
jgi:hypothetical protein